MSILEDRIQKLVAQFGHCKVNLVYEDGENEGVWVVPIDAESRKLIDDDNSRGDLVRVLLCNQPLGWCGKSWGDEIVAETQGDCRPTATRILQPK